MSDYQRKSNDAPLKDLVDRWVKAQGLEGKMKEMEVINAWPELMGIAVANRTKSLSIRNKTLYIKMDSSVMRDELLQGKSIIIHRINEFVGMQLIDDIWFS